MKLCHDHKITTLSEPLQIALNLALQACLFAEVRDYGDVLTTQSQKVITANRVEKTDVVNLS